MEEDEIPDEYFEIHEELLQALSYAADKFFKLRKKYPGLLDDVEISFKDNEFFYDVSIKLRD